MSYNMDKDFKNMKEQLEKLTNFSDQDITKIESVSKAVEKAYSEANKWFEIEDAIVVFSDLKNSTKISIDKQKRTMTKILEYLNYPFITIHNEFGADFIDIQGDGGLAIYHKDNAIKALLASITIKTYYEKYLCKKLKSNYNIEFITTTGIAQGSLLVKKIGKRDAGKFHVWAGDTINKSALISKELKSKMDKNSIEQGLYIGITDEIYKLFKNNDLKTYLLMSCNCDTKDNKPQKLWTTEKLPKYNGKEYHSMKNIWCNHHGQEYLDKVLEIVNNLNGEK